MYRYRWGLWPFFSLVLFTHGLGHCHTVVYVHHKVLLGCISASMDAAVAACWFVLLMISGGDAASISDRRDRGCAGFASPALLRWPQLREACPSQRANLAISPS